MTDDEFWNLIETARREANCSLEWTVRCLRDKLEERTPEEIVSFQTILARYFDDANSYDLWVAAGLIDWSCSDDSFAAFRLGLIGHGKEIYQAAMRDPDSLANVDDYHCECYDFWMVSHDVYLRKTGSTMPDYDRPLFQPHAKGEYRSYEWGENALIGKFPKLWKRTEVERQREEAEMAREASRRTNNEKLL